MENNSIMEPATSKKTGSKTTCLFCYTPISTTRENPQDILRRKKVLKAVCFHMQMGNNICLPQTCTKTAFPFCNECDKLLEHFLEYQELMEVAKRRISKLIPMIEQKVVKGEILGRELKKQKNLCGFSNEDQKFIKLREMILEGYRTKLLIKQRLRDKITLGEPIKLLEPNFSHVAVIKDKELNQFRSLSSSTPNYEKENDPDDENDDDLDTFSRDIDYESSIESPGSEISERENIIPPSTLAAIRIKQELMLTQRTDPDSDEDSNQISDVDDDEIMALAVPNRRLMFKGVEIYKCAGNRQTQEFLHCSICNFRVPDCKDYRKENNNLTPFKRIKNHILKFHSDVLHPSKIQTGAQLHQCLICNQTFTSRIGLRDHKTAHPVQEKLECDICGRIMKTKSQFHLILHKFSHKNDQERKAAIAAGESGTYTPLLCAKLRNHFMRKKDKDADWRKKVAKPAAAVRKRSVILKPVNCPVCNKTFTRKCYLTRHLKIHNPNYTPENLKKPAYSKKSSLSNLIGLLHKRRPINSKTTRVSSKRQSRTLVRRPGFLKQERDDSPPAPILQRMVDFD